MTQREAYGAAGQARPPIVARHRRTAQAAAAVQRRAAARPPVVEIAHNGEVYRLQATRLGKLILTK